MAMRVSHLRITTAGLILALASSLLAEPSSGTVDVTIFKSDRGLNVPYPIDESFGGLLLNVMHRPMAWIWAGLAAFVALMLALRAPKSRMDQKVWQAISLTGVFIFSAIVSFKVSNGWDELFIGAKHAHSMLAANRFSYNVGNMQEGNTEFLPLFVTGLLAKLGLPIFETLLTLGLAGNLWLILIAYKFFSRLTQSSAAGLIYATGMGLFPCVVITAMSGFFCCLFSAAVLSAFFLLFFSDHPKARNRGLVLLAFLTVFRMEGALLCFLAWLYLFILSEFRSSMSNEERLQSAKKAVVAGALLAAPFAASCLIRYLAFGHPIPAPVALKNGGGNPIFINLGRRFLSTVLDSFNLREVLILTLPAAVVCFFEDRWMRKLAVAWLMVIVFSIPYVVGGGDWFPQHWARYFLPAILISYILWWGTWATVARRHAKQLRWVQPALAVVLVLAPYAAQRSYFEVTGGANAFELSRRFTSETDPGDWQWGRVNLLGKFGLFLKETTSKKVLIGSPEEATMMYFANRDVVDLMGFATPEIAYEKTDPLWPDRMERPNSIFHRKRNPAVLLKYRPGILALWELAHREPAPRMQETDSDSIDHYLYKFQELGFGQKQIDIAYFRVGSIEFLKRLGYRPVIVGTPDCIFFYWVNDDIYKQHIAAVESLGCREIGRRTLSYSVSPDVTDHFSSGEELLGGRR